MSGLGSSRDKRIALVIGNGAYLFAPPLPTPPKDAMAMSEALKRLNFDVISVVNGDFEHITKSLEDFKGKLSESGTGLVYYSGHGLQMEGTNYVVSVDSDITSDSFRDSLVSIQDITEALSGKTRISLVLLDACRDNPFEAVEEDPSDPDSPIGSQKRLAKSGGAGLAFSSASKIQNAGETFIAFAAAPGKVAWTGQGDLSIFTKSLVEHIEKTELSINNLMIRVGLDVQKETEGAQEPWTSSSLRGPFYFKAGSLIWFSGNLIALSALIVSVLSLCLVVADRPPWPFVSLAAVTSLATLTMFLLGLSRAYDFMRGEIEGQMEHFWSRAAAGGFLGAILAAPIIAWAYYAAWQFRTVSFGHLLAEVVGACILTGMVLSISYVIAKKDFLAKRLKIIPVACRHIFGATVGGLLAGVIVGPPITAYFGLQHRPPATPEILLPGALIGTAAIVCSTISYSYEKMSYGSLARNAAVSIGATIVISVLGFLGFYIFRAPFENLVLNSLYDESWRNLITAGLMFGPLVGLILGATIGLAMSLARET